MSQVQLTQEEIKTFAQKGRDSLFFLSRAILGFNKITKKIHLPLCKELEDFKNNTREVVILPRDWYKTTICTISYPIWRAINNPEIRTLVVQNTYTNATSKLASVKQIFEKNELFRACYPELLPTPKSSWSRDSLCLNRKGTFPESTFEGAGTSTAVTSRHYDLIIEDDTVAPDFDSLTGALLQPTQAEVEKCIGWHRLTHPLLIEPALSQILVVGTRWLESDLIGWITEHEPQYRIYSRSCCENSKGESDPDGEPTWTVTDEGLEKFTPRILDQLKAALGPYMFSALYLNLPLAGDDMVFRPDWINYYTKIPKDVLYFTSLDPASAEKTSSTDPDYTVILTTAVDPNTGHIYIVHYDRGRTNPGDTIDTLFVHNRAYGPQRVALEAISYQRTLSYWIQQRQKKESVFFLIDEITGHKASKVARIRALQPYFATNKIFINPAMPELESELNSFPYGKHDDILDALAMQLGFWNEVKEDKEPSYARTYHDGSAAWIIDQIQNQRKKHLSFPYDVGLMSDRLNDARSIRGKGLQERHKLPA